MKKDVKVTIRGIHSDADGESIEVVSLGEMIEEDEQLLVQYEEAADDDSGMDCELVKNTLKISPDQVEIIKKGPSETHMIFIEDKDTLSFYSTPFGELEVSIHTDKLERVQTEKGFQILLKYSLDVNAAHMSDCNVDIRVDALH